MTDCKNNEGAFYTLGLYQIVRMEIHSCLRTGNDNEVVLAYGVILNWGFYVKAVDKSNMTELSVSSDACFGDANKI